MRKQTGDFIVELYDKYGSKTGYEYASGFIDGRAKAVAHEQKEGGNNAGLYRVLYNTHDKE